MDLSADDYSRQLVALLPPGPAWSTDDDAATLTLQLNAWAQEFARVQARAATLTEEADPRGTYELLTDYERIFGLPTACMYGIEQSLEQRHDALVSQMTSLGGQSRAYFIALALAAGFTITITEFVPFNVGMTVADPIYGPDWYFAWQVNASLSKVVYFRMRSGVNEALAAWGNQLLECLINRYKPAQTLAIFSYA
jgi:uncharacterized protein YmfQ (DUF2313 family)